MNDSTHSFKPFLRHGRVIDAVHHLAEEMALQLTADRYAGDCPARYIESVEAHARDLVLEALGSGEADTLSEWLDDRDVRADREREATW